MNPENAKYSLSTQISEQVTTSSTDNSLSTSGETVNFSHRYIRILVVDDEPVNRMILKKGLSLNKFVVDQAINGSDALFCMLAKEKYDLIIAGFTGEEVTRLTRAKVKKVLRLPSYFL